jgi:hypothetical protein
MKIMNTPEEKTSLKKTGKNKIWENHKKFQFGTEKKIRFFDLCKGFLI